MIELWGTDVCLPCKQAREYLEKTPIEFKYIDITKMDFEGVIPRLILDGKEIIGLPAIVSYANQWLKERGIPEGIA